MPFLKKILLVLAILLGIAGIAGYFFANAYENEVKQYIVEQINDRIATEIDIKDIQFSVFQRFPYASLQFKQVSAEEVTASQKKQTLFTAQSIYLQFNIVDIINRKYVIKKVLVKNGIVNIRIDQQGNDNYHFWKASDTTNTNQLSLALESLKVKGMTLYLLNEYKKLDMAIEIDRSVSSGNFAKEIFTLNTDADILIHQFNKNDRSVMKNKRVGLNASITVNQQNKTYTVNKGAIALEDLHFDVSGLVQQNEKELHLDLHSQGKALEINSIFSLFPSEYQKHAKRYETEGNITYEANVTGAYSAKKTPAISVQFSIANGKVKASNKAINQLSLEGSYSNGSQRNLGTSTLAIHNLKGTFGAGHISGDYVISNFDKPYIDFKSKAKIDLEQAKAFLALDTLKTAKGDMELNLHYKGYINDLNNIKAHELRKLNASGSLTLTNVNFQFIHNSKSIHDVSGFFEFDNNRIHINRLEMGIDNSHLNVAGTFHNLLAYLFVPDEKLAIKGNLQSPMLNLNELLQVKNKSTSDTSYALDFSEKISLQLNTKIDTLIFRKFQATNFIGSILLSNKKLTASKIYFNALEGTVSGKLAINTAPKEEITIHSKVKVSEIDIHALFVQCENFGQKYFLAKNIKGYTTTNIDFSGAWDKQFKVNSDKILVNANVTINNGELIDYKPVMALSKFIEVNELKRILFSKLQTEINIKNRLISFPTTEIASSALDLTFMGTHSFDQEIDYKFKVLLNDVLWRKAKRKKENTEFGYIQDDGLGKSALFLSMTGTTSDYKIKYDTKALKNSFKTGLQSEKKTLKKVLHDEFNWFKKDTSLRKTTAPESDDIQFEWEEDDDYQKEETSSQPRQKTKKKKKLGKLLEKIAQPQAEEYEETDEF